MLSMKKILAGILVAGSILICSSCGMNVLRGEGKKTTLSPAVNTFDAVDVTISSKIKITVAEGSAQLIELSGYENILKHIKTEVKKNTLYITFDLDDTWTVNEDDMEIRISVPALRSLSMSGAPDAEIHGNIKGSEFRLDVSGASEVTIDNINVDKLVADLSGASELVIKGGVVKDANYDISGAGKIEAFPLQTIETSASISGAAKSEVSVSGKLEASISGAGSVKYKGKPEVIEHISGVGSVEEEK
jgi:hypothetical protein